MRIEPADIVDLQPIIAAAVRATVEQIDGANAKLGERLGFTEPESAALIGVASHVLRDCRLRGEISAKMVGKRWIYSRESLIGFLDAGRPKR